MIETKVYRRDLVLSEMATGRAWIKYNAKAEMIWIEDADGKDRWITGTQARLMGLLQEFMAKSDGTIVRMRDMAEILSVAPSTVSRGMVKLASFGLVQYTSSRGRHGRTIIYRMVGPLFTDVRKQFREAAKAKVRAWRLAAEARVSRLRANVASLYSWREIEVHGLDIATHYLVPMGATLERPWTAEEIREALGE